MYPHPGDQHWLTSYGLVLVLALVTGWWLARRSARKAGLDPSHIDLLWPLAPAVGFAFAALPVGAGIGVVPLILVCTAVVFVYSRVARLAFLTLVDILAMPTVAAIMLQRIGCLLAGCCWGDPAGDAWRGLAVRFPAGSFAWEQHLAAGWIGPDAPYSLAVHPTQVYEAALLAPVVFALWRLGTRRWPAGQLTLLAVGCYGVVRFGIEFLRADNVAVAGPLSATQVICCILVVGALAASRMNTNAVH